MRVLNATLLVILVVSSGAANAAVHESIWPAVLKKQVILELADGSEARGELVGLAPTTVTLAKDGGQLVTVNKAEVTAVRLVEVPAGDTPSAGAASAGAGAPGASPDTGAPPGAGAPPEASASGPAVPALDPAQAMRLELALKQIKRGKQMKGAGGFQLIWGVLLSAGGGVVVGLFQDRMAAPRAFVPDDLKYYRLALGGLIAGGVLDVMGIILLGSGSAQVKQGQQVEHEVQSGGTPEVSFQLTPTGFVLRF